MRNWEGVSDSLQLRNGHLVRGAKMLQSSLLAFNRPLKFNFNWAQTFSAGEKLTLKAEVAAVQCILSALGESKDAITVFLIQLAVSEIACNYVDNLRNAHKICLKI